MPSDLIVIFAFIIALVAIKRYFQWKRHQEWHQTARLALEKGQPLPPNLPDIHLPDIQGRIGSRHGTGMCDLRNGLIALAVGAGMYYALPGDTRLLGAIPAFVGVALLISGLFQALRSDKSPEPRDPTRSA